MQFDPILLALGFLAVILTAFKLILRNQEKRFKNL